MNIYIEITLFFPLRFLPFGCIKTITVTIREGGEKKKRKHGKSNEEIKLRVKYVSIRSNIIVISRNPLRVFGGLAAPAAAAAAAGVTSKLNHYNH